MEPPPLVGFRNGRDDFMPEYCLSCKRTLPERRKLVDFCSYSCRGQHAVNTLDGPSYQTGLSGSKNLKQKRALRNLKRASRGEPTFTEINSVTYRINRPHKADAVGWLMEVNWPGGKSARRWVACVGNHRSEPLPLEEAKRAAKDFLALKSKGEPRDLIAELNDYHAEAVKDAEPLLNISDDPPPTQDDWRYIVQTECAA
jgi:O6-methylguanine-DNA--protein-cysteine methyltransferase